MCVEKTRSRRLAIFAGALVGSVASLSGADTVCAFNFNLDMEGQTLFKADHGTGVIDASASSEWLRPYAGTDLGAYSDDESGLSFGFRSDAANGSGFELSFSGLGAHLLQFAYRSSATGFHECEVQRLTSDGWEVIGGFGDRQNASTWRLVTVPLEDVSGEMKLRLVLDGATSSGSTARFDNMRVTSIPAPASIVALSELGICGLRGRRGAQASTQDG